MKPRIAINGAELGLLTSNTYVLEKIINMLEDGVVSDPRYPNLRYYSFIPNFPELWDSYIFFHRDARRNFDGRYGGGVAYPIPLSDKNISFTCGDSINIYAYRPIQESDIDLKLKFNIFNEEGKLFYSASKLPLRIKTVLTDVPKIDFNGVVEPVFGYENCMVMSQVTGVDEASFFSIGYGYGITNDGVINRAAFFAQYGGGESYDNDQGCIVAYAPDTLPRWK
ncbi:hypothetical protein ACBQ54_00175 [Providencia vermicola]|uniref:hypothetical protein n=1 Tax=Providencia vermicola TaxID=333965 RepID=UPI00352497A0